MAFTELLVASVDGNLSRVRELIAAGANVNETVRGYSPIYEAALHEHVDVVKELINAGANVNLQTQYGTTPLAELCSYGMGNPHPSKERIRLVIIKLLLEAGADIHKADNKGRTPIIHAASYSYYERIATVKLLIKSGANVNDVANNGLTALIGAAFQGHLNIVKALINAGADVNKALIQDDVVFGEVGDTALSIATKYIGRNRKEIIEAIQSVEKGRRKRVIEARWAERLASGNGHLIPNVGHLVRSYLLKPNNVRPTNIPNTLRNKKLIWSHIKEEGSPVIGKVTPSSGNSSESNNNAELRKSFVRALSLGYASKKGQTELTSSASYAPSAVFNNKRYHTRSVSRTSAAAEAPAPRLPNNANAKPAAKNGTASSSGYYTRSKAKAAATPKKRRSARKTRRNRRSI